MSPKLRDHLFEKLVLGLVSCTLVQSQMYEYLKHMEYPPERGYDRKILESNCKIGRVNLNQINVSKDFRLFEV